MTQKSRKTGKRGPGRPFPKGVSGNPGGRPVGLGTYIRKRTKDGEAIADFMLTVMADTSRKIDQRMEAATWLADRMDCDMTIALTVRDDATMPVRTGT